MDALFFPPGYAVRHHQCGTDHHTLHLENRVSNADCPDCGVTSHAVHGIYWRHPQDVLSSDRPVQLWIRVKRFRCDNKACSRRTFAQSFPEFLSRKAQRTERLKKVQARVGLQLGGELGRKVLGELKLNSSGDTLLRATRTLEPSVFPPPRVIGVDDWAFRKGHTYGTIIVDLEQHRVLDLLPDRTATTLKAWLEKHPSIEIVARDRASEYSRAISSALPQAQQVADRFHLVKNLSESVRAWIARERLTLQPAVDALKDYFLHPVTSPLTAVDTRTGTENSAPSPVSTRPFLEAVLSVRPGRKSEVEKAASTSTAPLKRWWLQGTSRCVLNKTHEIMFQTVLERFGTPPPLEALEREMRTPGFDGSSLELRQRLYHLNLEQGLSQPEPLETVRTRSPFHAHASTRLLTWPESKLEKADQKFVALLGERNPLIARAYTLIQELRILLGGGVQDATLRLQSWLERALHGEILELKALAKSFKRYLDAVIAGITLPWSSGQAAWGAVLAKTVGRWRDKSIA